MNISNMSATFIRSDRVLYWRDVKRLIRDRRERVPSRSEFDKSQRQRPARRRALARRSGLGSVNAVPAGLKWAWLNRGQSRSALH